LIDLLNSEAHGGLCKVLLTPQNVEQLIAALTAWYCDDHDNRWAVPRGSGGMRVVRILALIGFRRQKPKVSSLFGMCDAEFLAIGYVPGYFFFCVARPVVVAKTTRLNRVGPSPRSSADTRFQSSIFQEISNIPVHFGLG
jgi:hypothetical protein